MSTVPILAGCRRGPKWLMPKTVIVRNPSETYEDLFDYLLVYSNLACNIDMIEKVIISSSHNDSDGVEMSSLNLPISTGIEMGFNLIVFVICPDIHVTPSTSAKLDEPGPAQKNAFAMMMNARPTVGLPSKIVLVDRKLVGPEELFNNLVDFASSKGAGWSIDAMESGERVIKCLRNSLWYVEHAHDRMAKQGAKIPECFSDFSNLRDMRQTHKKLKDLKYNRLCEITEDLNKCLLLPSMTSKRNLALYQCMESLLSSIIKYRDHLKHDATIQSANHNDSSLNKDRIDSFDSTVTEIEAKPKVDKEYEELDVIMDGLDPNDYVPLELFCPADRIERRKYLKNLRLSCPVTMFRAAYGGSLGTITFLWKTDQVNSQKVFHNSEMIHKIKLLLPKYTSRAVQKEFINKYAKYVNLPKYMMRQMFYDLTDSEPSPETKDQWAIDQRVAQFLFESDDTDLILDHRSCNGKASEGVTKFGRFFEEVQSYFDEQLLAVEERRHGAELYMPLAISIEDLRNEIKKRIPDETAVPSCEMLRLQFHPQSAYNKTAARYTGRFEVKFRVQSRMSKISHPDGKYVAMQYRYLKEFAVKYSEYSNLFFLDDKATVPIGEPGIPISTGVRGHNRVLAPVGRDIVLTALDHDYHVSGIVPSVVLACQIPPSPDDSFFAGSFYVTVKEKIFQPSSPIRHAAELLNIIRTDFPEERAELPDTHKPILLMFTDGGPDHRTTFETVRLSLLALFIQLDLDVLIAVRTAPYNSWMNPAERVMSVLNLALQHASLQRSRMPPEMERAMKNKKSMASVRNYAEAHQEFQQAYSKSMLSVIETVQNRFERMAIKEEPIQTDFGASDEALEQTLQPICEMFNCRLSSKSTSKDIKAQKELQMFVERHCKSSTYTFQLRKCADELSSCEYCTINPPRLPQDVLNTMHFLPDPTPQVDDPNSYQSFQELYGRETSGRYQPSLIESGITLEAKEEDKKHIDVLKSQKVRGAIVCCECQKPRCVHSQSKLTLQQETSLINLREEWYVCGDAIPDIHSMVMRRSITCSSQIEPSYYSSACHLPPVCCHCGQDENLLDDFSDYMMNMNENYSTVRPICTQCRESGKESSTWGKKFFKKQRK